MMEIPRCLEQAEECARLMKETHNADEVEILRNIRQSWSRLAGQIDRYRAFKREHNRLASR